MDSHAQNVAADSSNFTLNIDSNLTQKKNDSLAVKSDSLRNDSTTLSDEMKSKVKYNAKDSIVYDLGGQKIYLYGNAEINFEDINLKAAFIEINYETKTVFAKGLPDSSGKMIGLPVFKQAKEEFKSQQIRYNFETKKGKISEITTQEGDSYVHGTTVKKEPDNTTFIRNGYYTTCNLDHPHYFIYSRKIKVIPKNKIVTGPAQLYVGDVPTPFAIPFGFFPNKQGRSSGILLPAYGESTLLGFYLQNGGYYFGMNDHFDLSLTGDIYSRGSWRANAYSVYSDRYHYSGNFSANYSITKSSQKELPDYSVEKGFFIRWNHIQDPKARPNSNFSANVNVGSSSFYHNNLSSATNFLTNTFTSSIAYSKTWPEQPYSFSASLSHSQNTSTHVVNLSLPTINFGVNRQNPFKRKEQVGEVKWYEKIGVSYNMSAINSITTIDSLLFKKQSENLFRYGVQHTIPVSTSFTVAKFFTVSPSINYSEKWYLQTIRKHYDVDSNKVFADTVSGFKSARDFGFSTSINTRIYGVVQFKHGKITAIRHVLTPSLAFSWRPDFSTSNWGVYKNVRVDSLGTIQKYSIYEQSIFGGPASGKSSLLSFSLDNNLEMKMKQVTDTAINSKKIKIFESLALSGNYNFAADSMRLSMIGLTGRTTLFDKINFSFSGIFDPYVTTSTGARINKTTLSENGKLARFTSGNLSVNFSLTPPKKEYKSASASKEELSDINKHPGDYVDYNIPFNLSVGYSLYYSDNVVTKSTTQTVNFNGDLQLTPGWKILYSSGYDFQQKDVSYTSIGIFRDLHCWEMRLNWVPFGFQQNYYFQINVKSSALQDLKLMKKNDRFDR